MKSTANSYHDLVISIHILPYELEDYRRVITKLNLSKKYIGKTYNIIIHSTLNLNDKLTNWAQTKLDKDYVIKLYDEINTTNVYTGSVHELNYEILGVDDHRRISIEKFNSQTKHMSYLDCDLYFNERHLSHLLGGLDKISSTTKYYILTPQLVKLWDNTWNCLVNKQYKTKSFKYHKTTDPRTIVDQYQDEVSVFPLRRFKWGGGWFNGFSMNLLTYVGVPATFIGYGLDDTYTMECAMMMSKYGYSVKQYVLKNSIVMEDYTNINKSFKNNFKINDIRDKLLKQTRSNYKSECNLFLTKVRQTPYI